MAASTDGRETLFGGQVIFLGKWNEFLTRPFLSLAFLWAGCPGGAHDQWRHLWTTFFAKASRILFDAVAMYGRPAERRRRTNGQIRRRMRRHNFHRRTLSLSLSLGLCGCVAACAPSGSMIFNGAFLWPCFLISSSGRPEDGGGIVGN